MPLSLSQEQSIQRLYLAYFNRPADVAGIKAWTEALNNGATEAQIAEGFANSPEFKATYKDQSTINYVNALYNNLLGRNSDAEGLVFWVNMVDSGRISKAQLPLQLTEYTGFADSQIILNKLHAATAFTTALKTAANPAALALAYQPSNAVAMATAHAYLSAIDYMPASLEQALASLPNLIKQFEKTSTPVIQNTVIFADKYGNTETGQGMEKYNTTGASNDLIKIKNLYLTQDAVINGGQGEDTLELIGEASIENASMAGIEHLKITPLYRNNEPITSLTMMTVDQYNSFAGSISAPSERDWLVFFPKSGQVQSGSKVRNFSAANDIELYDCAENANFQITGSAKGNEFNFRTQLNSGDTVTGGDSLNDIISVYGGSNADSDFNNITKVETINIKAISPNSQFIYKPDGAFATDTTIVNFNVSLAYFNSSLALDLSQISNRGLHVYIQQGANSSANKITTSTTLANLDNVHLISGLNWNDRIDMAGDGERSFNINLLSFNKNTFASEVKAKLANLNGYNPMKDDLIIVRINGSDSNFYAMVDVTGDGISSDDAVVHLVGTKILLDGTYFI